ncbi:Kinetochore protein spc25 [Neolecta irregularis DAH-3]|uniref:Kinetochore protein SPC25 n=1 Tax=Neolecta irregularis (strain DAH-3) TaxID=1198029 RepID=A0A1U7LI25_NEOID|nr:Kinetochore protein spc25 [Neolecta irregularis DAH-3]|eukprot:OLL22310.1 Kinetochore protein spc25 [Neolecta irregularis DAH-3]
MSHFQDSNPIISSLPKMNVAFDDLKAKMAKFTIEFDDFVKEGRERILLERNGFAKTASEDREKEKGLRKQIEGIRHKERETQQVAIAKEREEVEEAEKTNAALHRKKEEMIERKQILTVQIEEGKIGIQKKREFRTAERQTLACQSSKNTPELEFWEDHLGMKILGLKDDFLQIVFTHINEHDWQREYYVTLDLSERNYQVPECKPLLNQLAALVDRLNETRDFPDFLKRVRKGFKEYAFATSENVEIHYFTHNTTTAKPVDLLEPEEKIYIDRPLPSVTAGRNVRIAWFIGALATWGVSLAAIFNYEKQSSPVVHSTLYSLRRNAIAKEILGDDIQHSSKWPWITGTINPQHGKIDMSYKVKGERRYALSDLVYGIGGEGLMTFHCIRRSKRSEWEVITWKITDSTGRAVDLGEDAQLPEDK